jgi:predicted membrane metal-binding protein
MSHEVFNRDEEVEGSSDRSFGLVMAAFFSIVALWPLIHDFSPTAPRWWAVTVAGIFAGLALSRPALLGPLNKLWMKFGLLLHMIVSPIVLGLLFYVSVMPIGLLMRALGKDPLRLRRDPNATSYWLHRTPPGPAPETMKNQF